MELPYTDETLIDIDSEDKVARSMYGRPEPVYR